MELRLEKCEISCKSMKNKVLIIGGEGYIGSVVSTYFLNNGYLVDSYDCLIYQNNKNLLSHFYNPRFNFIKGEMSELELKVNLSEYETIILLAGLVGDPITKKYHNLSIKINESDILSIIKLIKNYDLKFIFSSTCSNYGLRENLDPANEDDPLEPLSTYAKSKVLIEKNILSLKNESNFRPLIFRFATAFGISPRMRFDLTINQFTRDLVLKKTLKVYDKDTWRPYCHVIDFANILLQANQLIDKKDLAFEVFNVGVDENNASKFDIINIINNYINEIEVEFLNESIDKRNYVVSFSKLKSIFDTSNFMLLDNGIQEIINLVKKGVFDHDKSEELYGNYNIKL